MSLLMTMRLKSYQALAALSLCAAGLLLLAAALFSSQIFTWLSNHFLLSLSLSILMLMAAAFLIFKMPAKGRTLNIRHVEGLKISFAPKAISDALSPLFEKLFPGKEVKKDVLFHKGSVHIFIDLPYHAVDQQQELLESIERELKELLHKLFGYNNNFLLVTSFQDSPS